MTTPQITPIQTRVPEETQEPKNDVQENVEQEDQYLSGWSLSFVVMALMLSAFMLALDNTVLSTAIPRITSDFKSLNDIGWYGSAYLITQMSLLPTYGRIYTCFNVKHSYCIALLIFEVGSVICAAAPNSMILILGRAIAGVGASGLMAGAAIIISYSIAIHKRATLFGMLSAVYGVASVAGPLIGGVLVDTPKLTWRFCFWINLPIGAISILQIWLTLKKPPPAAKAGLPLKQKLRHLDLIGASFLIAATICLLLALQWGGIVFAWSDARVYGCLIAFGLIMIAFFILQVRDQESCTLPLHIFRNRTVSCSCVFMACLQMSMTTLTYYLPIYFQSVKDTTAKASGLYLLPNIISSSTSTLFIGWVVSKIGYYVPFMWAGAPILATGGGLLQLIGPHSTPRNWIPFQIVCGIGYGLCSQIPMLAVQVVLEKADVPVGVTTVMFFQSLGGAMATSIAQNLFTDTLLKKLHAIEGVDGAAVVRSGAKDFRTFIPDELMGRVVLAFDSAVKTVFIFSVVSAGMALIVSSGMHWLRIPTKEKVSTVHQQDGDDA